MHYDSDFLKVAYTQEELQHYLDLGFHLVENDKDDCVAKALNKFDFHMLTYYKDYNENTKAMIKARKESKHKFFECIEKYLEEWWD